MTYDDDYDYDYPGGAETGWGNSDVTSRGPGKSSDYGFKCDEFDEDG